MQRILPLLMLVVLFTLRPAFARDVKALQASAENGDASAQFALGQSYFRGTDVEQSDSLAFQWFEKAAAQGNAEAESALGFLYAQGRGVAKDPVLTKKWFRLAADQGLLSAQHNLGILLLQEKDSTQEGLALLEKAAAKDYLPSQYRLGQLYFSGDFGLTRDYPKAFAWLLKAGQAGDAAAQNYLGIMYRSGFGVEQNPAEAFKWFQSAATGGNPAAQGNLGHFYAAGSVVPRDVVVAYKWFKLGSMGGDVGSANQLTEVTRVLRPDQIKQGDALAASFREKSSQD